MSDFHTTKYESYWIHQMKRNKRTSNEKEDETDLDERLEEGFNLLNEDDFEEDKDLGMLTEDGEK